LKRCTNIEILWYRKLVSLASPEFREILLPRSLRRWRADALLLIIIIIIIIIIFIIYYMYYYHHHHHHHHHQHQHHRRSQSAGLGA